MTSPQRSSLGSRCATQAIIRRFTMPVLAEEELTQQQQDFSDCFSALKPAKQSRVLELLALARDSYDERERHENLVVASKLLFGQPKVRTEPLRASEAGKEKLQRHR